MSAARPSIICREHPAHGRFRIFTRSDGKFAVYDPDRPMGERTVAHFPDLKGAQLFAERAAAGCVT